MTVRVRRWLLLLWCGLASVTVAQTGAAKKQAADHYKKGVGLFKEGDFGAALAEFKAAYQAVPSFEVLYNLGLTERRLFKYGQAVKTLNRYLEEGGKKVPPDRRESVVSELSQIRSLTSKVTVTVEGPAARVNVDGEDVGLSPLPEAILLGPGKHTIKATRDAEPEPVEVTFELASGSSKEVALAFKPQVSQGPVEVTLETDPKDAVLQVDGKLAGVSPTRVSLAPGSHEVIAELDGYQSARTDVMVEPGKPRTVKLKLVVGGAGVDGGGSRGRFPVLGVVLLGAGVLAGGAAALFAVEAGNASRQVSEFFRLGGAWDPTRASVEAGGLRDQTLSAVFLVASGVLVAAGVVATVVTLAGGASDSADAQLLILPSPHGAWLTWSTRW